MVTGPPDAPWRSGELKNYLQKNLTREEWFYTSNNERFRRNLYDVYLGGAWIWRSSPGFSNALSRSG